VAEKPSALSTPTFVGRLRELRVVAEALARPPAVVLIEGEAGIGKSRLLREFLASPAGVSRGLSVTAACPPLLEPYTLGPVVDAVRQATDRVAGLGLSDLAGALRPLFPEWASDLPAAPEPAEDARAARHRLFRALTELIGCLGVSVLVVEDVHWADEATLEFLLFVASLQPQPVNLMVTYRPEDVPAEWLLLRLSSQLPAGTTRTRLVLAPLDLGETASLVSSMLGGEPLSAEFAAFVHGRTEGLPLAVEESVRLMHDRADVARHGGGWVRRHLEDIDVPPTVRDAVLERSTRLSGDALLVLRAVAVLAEPAGEATLAAVSGLPADRAADGTADALACGLVWEDERGLVSFRHGLAARAVYETISGPRRRAMHLRAGRALEETSPRSVVRLARHFREAGDTDAWARYAEQAADAAVAAGDRVAAATLLHNLLSSVRLPPAKVAPLAAKIPQGSLTGRSRADDVARSLRAALESGMLDPGQEAMARFRLGMALEGTDDEASRLEVERAIPGLRPGSLERVEAMLLLGWPRDSTCPGRVHREWLGHAGRAVGPVSPAERSDIATKRAVVLLLLGESEGWEVAATIPDEVSTPEQRRTVTHRDLNLGELAIRWGRYAEARSRLGNALELAETYGFPRYGEFVLASRIHLDWLTGNWKGLSDRAAELAETEDAQSPNRLQASLVSGLLLDRDGRHGEAEGVLQRVLAHTRAFGPVDSMMEPAAALARLYLPAGRVEDALHVTDDPMAVIARKETWLWATDLAPTRVDALVTAGRLDGAWSWWRPSATEYAGAAPRCRQPRRSCARASCPPDAARWTAPAAAFARAGTRGRRCRGLTRRCWRGSGRLAVCFSRGGVRPRSRCSPKSSPGCPRWARGPPPAGCSRPCGSTAPRRVRPGREVRGGPATETGCPRASWRSSAWSSTAGPTRRSPKR